MNCPFCNHHQTQVYNSRHSRGQTHVWRRRRCKQCENPFTTYEGPDFEFLKIRDETGNIQPYRRLKLQTSLWQAFGNDEEALDTVEALTYTIESHLLSAGVQEFNRRQLSQTVLETLKRYDAAAFLRYLSQRRDFASLQQLRQELQEL